MTRKAPLWWACLCLLPLLASCGLLPRKHVVSRPITIELPTLVYRPIPHQLTTPIVPPPQPSLLCVLNGQAAVCVLDALATIPAWDAALQMCNADRSKVRTLGATDGQ